VERVHQNRPQQADADQRQLTTIVERAQDQKMMEAQQAAEDRETQVQLQKEQERQAGDRRRRKQPEPEAAAAEAPPAQPVRGQKRPGSGDKIDITI
jgi:hypothetical protein